MSREYVLHNFRAPVELHIDYASELNEQQLAAVTAPPGPSLVIAGAGSGKTRTLTYRVAFLLEQGIAPERLLLLTFTNKAAREMMRRVSDLLGQDLPDLWGGTFHAIGNRVLRQHADLLGYDRRFSILDRDDATDLLKACLGDATVAGEIDPKQTRFPKAEVLGEIYSMAVNTQRSIADMVERQYSYFSSIGPAIARLQQRYEERKRVTSAMDFDDLLVLWLRLLREHPDVREVYQRRFQFLLVDEYQDTNKIQGDLIDLLAERHHNVMVVGDDAQSIYAWRGANFKNILEFPRRHPKTAVYRIETNYRSTPEILSLANAAIAANLEQFTKQLVPARPSGQKPALVVCNEAHEQAAFVAQRALELREEGTPLERMAVLYRSHFHALELQLELTRRNIPFSITSGIRFFEQAHVKDVAAYLKFIANPRDELSFKRLVQFLPGVGAKGAAKLWSAFSQAWPASHPGSNHESTREVDEDDPDWSLSAPSRGHGRPRSERQVHEEGKTTETDSSPPPAPQLATTLQRCLASVPKKATTAWAQFTATISQLESPPAAGKAAEMIRLVIEAGYEDHLIESYPNYRQRLDDLDQLASFAQQFDSLEDFLTQLALLTNVEAEAESASTKDEERLRLSTVHQAKGLEFDVVFVIMLCDGLFPSARSVESPEGEEEERRLFYVAVTRARNELYLVRPLIRATPGAGGELMQQPSRFLNELPENTFEEWNLLSNRTWL
jgi:DNA helicase-2/ATP-dependent DNA helicase PcrA